MPVAAALLPLINYVITNRTDEPGCLLGPCRRASRRRTLRAGAIGAIGRSEEDRLIRIQGNRSGIGRRSRAVIRGRRGSGFSGRRRDRFGAAGRLASGGATAPVRTARSAGGNFTVSAAIELRIVGAIAGHARRARRNFARIHRVDQFRRDHDQQFFFVDLLMRVAKRGADPRQIGQKRNSACSCSRPLCRASRQSPMSGLAASRRPYRLREHPIRA